MNASDSDPSYFKIVANYIHLNPARAGLAGGKKGKLLGYRWSRLPGHARGNGPDWLETGRLLRAFELAGDGRGRRAYVGWLEARAACDAGTIDKIACQVNSRRRTVPTQPKQGVLEIRTWKKSGGFGAGGPPDRARRNRLQPQIVAPAVSQSNARGSSMSSRSANASRRSFSRTDFSFQAINAALEAKRISLPSRWNVSESLATS